MPKWYALVDVLNRDKIIAVAEFSYHPSRFDFRLKGFNCENASLEIREVAIVFTDTMIGAH